MKDWIPPGADHSRLDADRCFLTTLLLSRPALWIDNATQDTAGAQEHGRVLRIIETLYQSGTFLAGLPNPNL